MQNSLLVLDFTKDGWTMHEHLKEYSSQTTAFNPPKS